MAFKLGVLKIADLLWKPSEIKTAFARMRQPAESSAGTYEAYDEEEEDSEQGESPNATNEQAQLLLKAIPRRIEALLDSAARTGAQTALQTVLTWYPTLILEKLTSIRDGASDLLESTYATMNRLAATMVGWFPHAEYTPYLDSDGN